MFRMNQNRWRWGWQFFRSLLGVGGAITLTEGFVGVFLGNCVSAQIVPDNTLGDEHSVVTPNVNINGLPAERIDGGATRDVNLFHSFSEFNVGNGQRVYFANPTGIENILTRVTGSNLSNILGTLGVDGGDNLFLLNPNGIFFGPNARLDIAGSFFASTADSVVFNNGYQFSAKNPESPPLLTISVRLGLQYGSNQSGATIANSGNLTVGKDLTLAAVNLDLQGQLIAGEILTLEAQDTVKVRDSVANPFMASSGSQLLVQGNQGVDIFALNHPDSGFFSGGDLVLRSANTVGGDAHYSTSGNFRIERLDGNPGNFYSPYDPVIRANGDVIFNSYQGTSLHIFAGGKVQIPGYVWITDQDNIATSIDEIITLSNGRTISINGSAQPTLDIRAGIDWTLLGGLPGNTATGVNAPPSIFGTNATSADIEIGTIFFNNTDLDSPLRGTVFLTNQYKRNESLDGAIKVNATVIGGSFTGIEAILTGDALGGGSVIIDSRSHIALNGVVAASALEFSGNYFGNGGDITLIANGDITSNYNILSLGLLGGNINLTSNGTIALTSNQVTSGNYGFVPGKGGDINFKARSVLLTDGALLNNITIGQGDTGKLTVQATDSVEVVGTSIDGSVMSGLLTQTEGTGSAGNLTIETPRLSIRDGARVSSLTFGAGNTGTIKVQATDFVEVSGTSGDNQFRSNLLTQVNPGAQGSSGNLIIETGRLLIRNGAQIGTGTFSSGRAGNLEIVASDSVEVVGIASDGFASGLFTDTIGTGDAGNLGIKTGKLIVRNGGVVSASTAGSGNAGNLIVQAAEIELSSNPTTVQSSAGLYTDVRLGAIGTGGNLIIETNRLTIRDGAKVSAGTLGEGNGGSLIVTASDSVELIGSSSGLFTQTEGGGNAGNLRITTGKLSIYEGAIVTASTLGQGLAGNVVVTASDAIELLGISASGSPSALTARTEGSGNAGDLRIATEKLILRDGAIIAAFTTGTGQAGTLRATATHSVEITGISADGRTPSGVYLDTFSSGDAGELRIDTRQLLVQEGGRVSARTSGTGRGGILAVNASDFIQVTGKSPDGQFSSGLYFDSRSAGDAKGISINTGRLDVQNRGQVTVSGTGSGSAGDLQITADSIFLNNQSQLLATNTSGAGNIRINTGELTVQNGSQVTVSGMGAGVSGNLDVKADSIFLNNQGNLTAKTVSGEGGNIRIQVDDTLLLRHNSNILTEALGSGNGGNITINAGGFVLAILPENSDVAATAIQGRGGNVFVTAQGVFGFSLPERLVRTPESDISAASELGINGTREIIASDYQPPAAIPQPTVPPEVRQNCQPNSASHQTATAQFYNTGRGGLPPNPSETLNSNTVQVPWVTLDSDTENLGNSENSATSTDSKPGQLVEAQGWEILPNGQVRLTAKAPDFSLSPCVYESSPK